MTNFRVKLQGDGQWEISVERTLQGALGGGSVVVRQPEQPLASAPRHAGLADGRAWLAVGAILRAGGDHAGAATAAKNGLQALGDRYASRANVDDTDMKFELGEYEEARGKLEAAAAMFLRVLESRCEMYAELNKADVVA